MNTHTHTHISIKSKLYFSVNISVLFTTNSLMFRKIAEL